MSSSSSVNIRPAERRDCNAIANLIKELASYEKMEKEAKLTGKDLERDAFDENPPYFKCIVAETDINNSSNEAEKVVIGYALYFHRYSTWEGKAIHLEDFYITPKFRQGGVGSKILKYLAKIAVAGGYARITLECLEWNKPAIQFYEKHNAVNLTQKEGWHAYRFTSDVLHKVAGI